MVALLTQGISLPKLGLGTFRMPRDACRQAVASALDLGYRHIDTAEMYGNEDAVGEAIAASGIARSDLHVTTKVWHENLAAEPIRRALHASLERLKLDFVDLCACCPGVDTPHGNPGDRELMYGTQRRRKS
jgi:2,5-diketo-D-gluconate reductase B